MTLSTSSTRANQRWLLLAAVVATCTLAVSAVALATPGPDPTPMPGGYVGFTVLDQQGANDVPGQVDLTQMGRDDATATTYKLFWSWDSISSWTGTGQTGDACALFDTDTPGNTFIDFVVCVRVENFQANPEDVRILSPNGVFAFSCTDKKNDRCTNPTPAPFTASEIQAGALGGSPLDPAANLITHTDPFPAGESSNHDSTVEIHILKSYIPLAEELVNVCSYPSAGNGGNNNPFDCIVSPGGGFLRIVKDAGGGVTSPNFTFDVHRTSTLLSQQTIAGSGQTALIPILVDPNSGPNVAVTETNINSAWQLTAVGCTVEDKVPPGTGTPDLANNKVTAVSIVSGKITTCTFTDRLRTGTLVVIKTVVNDNGGTAAASDFTYALNDGSGLANETGVASPGRSYSRNVGATFNVVENAGGPAGYSVSYDGCTGTIAANTTSTCTITNDDNAPALRLRKVVINNNGGTALATAWTLTATGTGGSPTNLSGTTPVNSGATFKADTYTLAETGGPAGYSASAWSCALTSDPNTPVTVTNSTVAVALGADVTCTITNNDQAATLIVRKVVINNNGGTLEADDFSFQVDGGTATSFITDPEPDPSDPLLGRNTLTVNAGSHDVTEPSVDGYTTTYDNCDDVNIANGATATCVITNDDTKASPTGTTIQSWVLKDSISIAGIRGGAPNAGSASVVFRLYSAAGCAPGALVGTETDASIVAGVASTANGIAVTASGFYYWTAQYSGDQFNNGFTTTCGDEVTQIQAKDAFGGGRNDLVVPS